MSFRFRSTNVTLENYSRIFEACSPDVLDEIRSAILDNTPIAPYIKPCGDDSYLLGQIRLGLREQVIPDYLNARLTGRTIYNIRQGIKNGRDMSCLLRFFTPKTVRLDKEIIEKLSEFAILGVDVSQVDFTKVPEKLVDIFCKGLYKGYPMWLLLDDEAQLSEELVHILMRGMALGVDVHPFLRGDWDKSSLLLLFSYNKSVDLNEVLRYINSRFDSDQVKVLLDLARVGLPIDRLCVKDSSGVPVYNSYQMYELGEAIKQGVDRPEMYDAELSDFEMAQMREKATEWMK